MKEVIEILHKTKQHITDNIDMMWTCFKTPAELRAEIEMWIDELAKENTKYWRALILTSHRPLHFRNIRFRTIGQMPTTCLPCALTAPTPS